LERGNCLALLQQFFCLEQFLPLSNQFVARFNEEDRLLQLAAQLETARPWFTRLPAWVTQV
jgi:Asp-tRNA(Asn)/Glu-tRNA(Gln) amidotransferase A subunit family amidase